MRQEGSLELGHIIQISWQKEKLTAQLGQLRVGLDDGLLGGKYAFEINFKVLASCTRAESKVTRIKPSTQGDHLAASMPSNESLTHGVNGLTPQKGATIDEGRFEVLAVVVMGSCAGGGKFFYEFIG